MIVHIVKRDDWEDAIRKGEYAPASLETEGFIHCSTAAQVVETANLFYRGQSDLVIVCLEEATSYFAAHLRTDSACRRPTRRRTLSAHIWTVEPRGS